MTFGCTETKRWIDCWVDGELDPSAALLVDAHVSRCAGCREEADSIRALKRAMAGMREASCPTALRHRICAALDEVDAGEVQAQANVKRRRNGVSFALTGAALAGVVLARGLANRDGGVPTASGPAMAGVLPMIEDVAQRHARDLPAEVAASDPAQVAQWFRGKLDIPVHPVMFRGTSARLVGARISNVRNQMAAALYYDVGGRRVTVFVFDGALMPRDNIEPSMVDGRPVYVASSHGYTVTLTEQQGVGYAIATDMPPQESVRIVASADLR
jgi:anti-sigma factor RsiW